VSAEPALQLDVDDHYAGIELDTVESRTG